MADQIDSVIPAAGQTLQRVATIRARRDSERNLTHYDVLVDTRVLDTLHKANLLADIALNVAPALIEHDLDAADAASPPA